MTGGGAGAVLEALAKATDGHARAAGDGDAVDGVPARWVAAPGSTDEAADALRVAAEHGLAVVARGAGSKLGWGAPPRRLDLLLDTRRLDRVVEHAAGDLVVVVQAGVPLATLAARLAVAGQRLALDEVVPGSTVGGAVATGLSGPRRLLQGTVRDLILGATLVRADGVVTRSGGKVVKNVAGYDVAKLVCGSYGTLGLVTQAAFRLHPVAPAAVYVTVAAPDAAGVHAAVQRALHAQFVPTAIEVDRPADGPGTAALLIEGTEAGVDGRAAQALAALGPGASASADPPAWWGRLPRPDRPDGTVTATPAAGPADPPGGGSAPGGAADGGWVLVKATTELAGLGRLLDGVALAAGRAGLTAAVRGSGGAGVLYAGLAGADPAAVASFVDTLRGAAPAWSGSVVVLAAPPAVRAAVDGWGPVAGLALMRRVKDQFDPDARLAPGRFVGGI